MAKTIQTRQEHYDAAKAAHDAVSAENKGKPRSQRKPLPDMPEPPVVAGPGVASTDLNGMDIRGFDPDTGAATQWRNESEKAEIDNDWAEYDLG